MSDHIRTDYLFVYSSLRKGFSSQEYEYITQYFYFVGSGKVRGILSIHSDILVGTPVDEEKYIVGELYKIKDPSSFSFAIGQLDEYEGLHPEPPEQPRYQRTASTIITENGEQFTAWVYWYLGSVHGLPALESGDVMEFLKGTK